MTNKIVVISAPSGGGKSVVAKYILENYTNFKFSISATTRNPRKDEIDGINYYFLSKEEFEEKISFEEFIEYEMFFDNYYGTLKSEIERLINEDKVPLFDIDVKGAYSLKRIYGENAILIFLAPPSLEVLRQRLEGRGTENKEQISKRLARSEEEIRMSEKFDYIVTNDVLDDTLNKIKEILNTNLQRL